MVHLWVPRVPRIVHLCMSKLVRTLRLRGKGAIYGYHGYQHKSFLCVCLCIGYNGSKYVLNSCVCRAIYGYHGYQVYFFCADVFFYGYHGYQVCLVLGYGVAIYGYHGYQLYFFCLGDFVMGTTVPSMFCIGVWGSDLLVPRVPCILLLSGSICNGYHGSKNVMNLLGFCNGYYRDQVCHVFVCGGAIYGYHGYQV